MKKLTLSLVIGLFVIAFNSQAQSATDNVSLNVKLYPIQTLFVNSNQKTVDLTYTTKEDYANGVTSEQSEHLTVYSTGGFEIKVEATGAALVNNTAGSTSNIDLNSISILASNVPEQTGGTFQQVSLSTSPQVIATSTLGGIDKKFNVQYKGAGANAYINNYIAGQDPTTYNTTVKYTIIAK